MNSHRYKTALGLGLMVVVAVGGIDLRMSTAEASPLWEFGGSATSGQSFSGRLTADGGDASYFNPARLAGQDRGVRIGMSGLSGRLTIALDDRPAGVDISDAIYDARIEQQDGTRRRPVTRPLPTDELPRQRGGSEPSFDHRYATVATVVPLIEDRWSVGFLTTVSAGSFSAQQPYYVDEREQYFSNSLHFERLGDRLMGSSFAFGTGVVISDGLRAGAGVTMAQDAQSENEMFSPDPTAPEDSEVNTAVTVRTRFVPHFGIDAEPLEDWTVAATAHAPFGNRVDGSNEIRFWDFPVGPDGEQTVDQQLRYLYDFEPWRIGAGTSYRWSTGERDIEGGIEVQYDRWSDYINRHAEVPVKSWNDTWTPTVSAAVISEHQKFSGDLQFAPSPVPDQDGRSNYVDNSRWAISGGWSRQFELFELPIRAGLQGQIQWLVEQRAVKSRDGPDAVIDEFPESIDSDGETIEESHNFRTNNPGYPGYRASGIVAGFGVVISSRF